MPLFTINIPEKASLSVVSLLERIAVALERIAGPVIEYKPPVQSTMKDYAIVTPEDADRIRQAQEDFGSANLLVPGSEAYLREVAAFETMVADAYGPEAVEHLPWRVHTGPHIDPSNPSNLSE